MSTYFIEPNNESRVEKFLLRLAQIDGLKVSEDEFNLADASFYETVINRSSNLALFLRTIFEQANINLAAIEEQRNNLNALSTDEKAELRRENWVVSENQILLRLGELGARFPTLLCIINLASLEHEGIIESLSKVNTATGHKEKYYRLDSKLLEVLQDLPSTSRKPENIANSRHSVSTQDNIQRDLTADLSLTTSQDPHNSSGIKQPKRFLGLSKSNYYFLCGCTGLVTAPVVPLFTAISIFQSEPSSFARLATIGTILIATLLITSVYSLKKASDL